MKIARRCKSLGLFLVIGVFFGHSAFAQHPGISVRKLVVHGDSITVGVGASDASRTGWVPKFKELVESYQNSPVKVVSLAVSGTDAVAQVDSGKRIAAEKSDLVCILLGINDMRQGRPVKEYMDAMEKILNAIRLGSSKETVIVLGAPTWMEVYASSYMNGRWGKGTKELHLEYRQAVRELAARYKCLFADTYAATEGNPAVLADTVHPNDAGHQLIADCFFKSFALKKDKTGN